MGDTVRHPAASPDRLIEVSPKDPVCGMTVGSASGYRHFHEGRVIAFCS